MAGNDDKNSYTGRNLLKINKDPPKKSIMFMDSNSRYLDPAMLWKNLTMIPCSTTQDLRNKLQSTQLDNYQIIFIHTGVNDIDTVAGEEVAKNIIDIVQKLHQYHPSIKIIVSEITPRQLFRDDEVIKCNTALRASLQKETNVTLAFHSNLRNEKWTFHTKNDDKHFSQVSISRFASNIKIAFRKSIGILSNKYGSKKQNFGADNHIRTDTRHNAKNNEFGRGYNSKKKMNTNNGDDRGSLQSFKQDLIKFLTEYK